MADQRKLPTETPERDGLNGLLFESIMNQSIDAIVITDPENKILHWSASANTLFGYAADEVVGKSVDLLLAHGVIHELRNGTKNQMPVEGKTRTGASIPLAVNFAETIDSDNNLAGLTYIFHDLREKARQEESMAHKVRALESFSYSVSHDLRAPLRRIVNYAEILQEDHLASMGEEVQRIISRMAKNAERMSELIDDLLTFSRVGQHTLQKSIVNVEALVKNVIEPFQKSADNVHPDFRIARLDPCEADPVLLKQALENLISNAVKFSRAKEHPTIDIGCIRGKDETTYFVKDNGVGFDMQYSTKLFNVFQRLHNPADFEGTGIGLAIVHQIISRHGGRVWAEGSVDEGATFYFTLPK